MAQLICVLVIRFVLTIKPRGWHPQLDWWWDADLLQNCCLEITRLLFENTFFGQRYIEKNRATRSNREKMRNILPIGRGQQFFCLL